MGGLLTIGNKEVKKLESEDHETLLDDHISAAGDVSIASEL